VSKSNGEVANKSEAITLATADATKVASSVPANAKRSGEHLALHRGAGELSAFGGLFPRAAWTIASNQQMNLLFSLKQTPDPRFAGHA